MYIPEKITYLSKDKYCSLPIAANSKRKSHYAACNWEVTEEDNLPVTVSVEKMYRYRYIPQDDINVTVTTALGKQYFTGMPRYNFIEAATRGMTDGGVFNDNFVWALGGRFELISVNSEEYTKAAAETVGRKEFAKERHIPYRRLIAGCVYRTRKETFGSNSYNEWYQGRYSTVDIYGNQKLDMHLVIGGMYSGDYNKNSVSDFKVAYLSKTECVGISSIELKKRVDYSEIIDYIGIKPIEEIRNIGMNAIIEEHKAWKASSGNYYYPKATTFTEYLKSKKWSQPNVLLANLSIDSRPYVNPGLKELDIVLEPKEAKKIVRAKIKSAE
jgi:hypothetical protein